MKTTITCAICGGIMYITQQFFTKDTDDLLTVYTCANDDCRWHFEKSKIRNWTFETEKYINPVKVL